ncbi:T9SS type A sorting domain-containing protein [Catalinimonas alkaloidigena]|nr:T9SS type A sorting domain-containing protein [Catalinimonas alkaloidigena]
MIAQNGWAQPSSAVLRHIRGASVAYQAGVLGRLQAPHDSTRLMHRNTVGQATLSRTAAPGLFPQALPDDWRLDTYYAPRTQGGFDQPLASISDGQGNTFITGTSSATEQPGNEVYTLKLNAEGDVVWQARQSAAPFAAEAGLQLAQDGAQNILVSGTYWNGSDNDLQVLKYDPNGQLVWQQVYSGPAEGIDVPAALTVDSQNNIIVAGFSWSGVSVDYLVIKYDPQGQVVWVARDAGLGDNTWNEPTAVAVDADDNVLVTGYSPNESGYVGYYTIKYDAAGDVLWQQRYDYQHLEEGEEALPTNSLPQAVAIDAQNAVYITGIFDYRGLDRFGTLKYTAAGEQQWVRTYRSPQEFESTRAYNLALHGGDTLYVAGQHNGGFRDDGYAVVAYTTAGDSLWAAETNGMMEVTAPGFVLDAAGRPTVGGKGFFMADSLNFTLGNVASAVTFDLDGTVVQHAVFEQIVADTASLQSLVGLGRDATGAFYLTVHSAYSSLSDVYETVKFAAAPADSLTEPAWQTRYTGPKHASLQMLDMVADGLGNTYVTATYGLFKAEVNRLDIGYALVKYDATGALVWEQTFIGDDVASVEGMRVLVDADNDLRVHLTQLPRTSFDSTLQVIRKYTAAGELAWETQTSLQRAQVVAPRTDAAGNTYLAGTAAETPDGMPTFALVKLDANGTEQWATYYAIDSLPNCGTTNTLLTNDGGMLLAGTASDGETTYLTVLKFNAEGEAVWATPVLTEPNERGTALHLTEDAAGSIYAAGISLNPMEYLNDLVTVKLDAAGQWQWTRRYGEASTDERPYGIRMLTNGDLLVWGYTLNWEIGVKTALMRYTPDGEQAWLTTLEPNFYYRSLETDGEDNSYILQQVLLDPFPQRADLFSITGFSAAALSQVDSTGAFIELHAFAGQAGNPIFPGKMVKNAQEQLVIGGETYNEDFYSFLTLFRSDEGLPTALTDWSTQLPTSWLQQNYPNPFRTRTTIPFTVTERGPVEVSIFDLQGRHLQTVREPVLNPGKHALSVSGAGLRPGVYLYRVTTATTTQSRKMIVD